MKREALLIVAVVLSSGGCDWFTDPAPNEARLVVEGEAGKSVRLIISTEFVAAVTLGGQTRVEIFGADTVVTTLPYERVYVIEEDQRFFAETAPLNADLEDVQMQVFVDSRKQFDERGVLRAGQPYRFVYTFNQAITRDIVVL